MKRKDFISGIVAGAASLSLINCIGCMKDGLGVAGPSNVDFNLDLNASANTALLTNGGYIISNGIIVARTSAGAYIAVQRSCTHENYNLAYQAPNHRFYCVNHGATFTESGTVTSGPARRALTVYNTQLTGTTLRIYS